MWYFSLLKSFFSPIWRIKAKIREINENWRAKNLRRKILYFAVKDVRAPNFSKIRCDLFRAHRRTNSFYVLRLIHTDWILYSCNKYTVHTFAAFTAFLAKIWRIQCHCEQLQCWILPKPVLCCSFYDKHHKLSSISYYVKVLVPWPVLLFVCLFMFEAMGLSFRIWAFDSFNESRPALLHGIRLYWNSSLPDCVPGCRRQTKLPDQKRNQQNQTQTLWTQIVRIVERPRNRTTHRYSLQLVPCRARYVWRRRYFFILRGLVLLWLYLLLFRHFDHNWFRRLRSVTKRKCSRKWPTIYSYMYFLYHDISVCRGLGPQPSCVEISDNEYKRRKEGSSGNFGERMCWIKSSF